MNTKQEQAFFIFDVESIGLHGEAFAVAGGIYYNGACQYEFCFSCPIDDASGDPDDREWIKHNVPVMDQTHRLPSKIREAFWSEWEKAKKQYPGIVAAAECLWPVEAGFFISCIRDNMPDRKWQGPYPFHDISSVMLAAGMDPMRTYERKPSELPAHHPLGDTRQSARLLYEALDTLQNSQLS